MDKIILKILQLLIIYTVISCGIAFAALDFDGVDDYFDTNDVTSGPITPSSSWYFRMRTTDTTATISLASVFNDGNNEAVRFYINSAATGYLALYTRDSGGTAEEFQCEVQSDTGVTDGVFHDILYVMDAEAGTCEFYVDGNNETEVILKDENPEAAGYGNWDYDISIGAANVRGTLADWGDWDIAIVAVWSSLLTQADATYLTDSDDKGAVFQVDPVNRFYHYMLDDVGDGESADDVVFIDSAGTSNGRGDAGADSSLVGQAEEVQSYL